MNATAITPRQPLPWSGVTDPDLVDLPKAARRIYPIVQRYWRSDREISIQDREFCRLCNVGRRCIQKGLRQLEDAGVIVRLRAAGRRIIRFLRDLATKKKTATSNPSAARPDESPAAILAALRSAGISATIAKGEVVFVRIPAYVGPPPSAELWAKAKANVASIHAYLGRPRPARE